MPVKRSQPGTAAERVHHAETMLLADIVASSFDAIFSRSLDGTVTSWNAAAERIFGFRALEIIGKSSAVLLPSDRPDEQQQMLDRIRRGQRLENFETIRLRKDGRSVAVSLTVSPIRDARRRIVGASTIARDISAQRELQAELLEISERERQRMGRDLHDGLGQQLTGMELLCRTLEKSLAQRGLSEAATAKLLVAQLGNAIEQTRALARGLVPVLGTRNGLMLALEDFAASASALYGIRCTYRCNEPVVIEEHTTAVHLYRIAQEAVSNAVRHGQATAIRISLKNTKRGISLTVEDNGGGFSPESVKSRGLGLHIMQYRAAIVGGALKIERTARGGMRVTCRVHWPQASERGKS